MRKYRFSIAEPTRRPLKIFAFDPMVAREPGRRSLRVIIDVPNEPLERGPRGRRIEVVDYDAAHNRYYVPVDLDDKGVLMQGGLEPDASDPRFHQQMVYAVAMKVLENFEAALGRTIALRRRGRNLRIFPHAFVGANAYYDRELHGLLFGYFRADRDEPGRNLPGQNVYTCLSHDIIAHEMTHALVDRLRRFFLEPSNEDVLAFHEGFADIVALFQHFSFSDIVRDQIQQARADLRSETPLVQLAQQFGYATGSGRALRSALGDRNKKLYRSVTEPHERGSILVAAVFDAFFMVYERRTRDLIRIATGGAKLPDADPSPDLVNRIAQEASQTAEAVLRMCIRAFDYLPPVDITFGDYLRALVTADSELNPVDDFSLRGTMIEAFRLRGIYPEGVASLDEEALLWPENPNNLPALDIRSLPDMVMEVLLATSAFSRSREATDRLQRAEVQEEESSNIYSKLHEYAAANAVGLHLDPMRTISVHGFHPIFRVGRNGRLLVEMVAQFAQRDEQNRPELGGIPFRGGTTVVFSTDGTVRYVIAKPLISDNALLPQRHEAQARLVRQTDHARRCALADPRFSWHDGDYAAQHMALRMNLAAIHGGIVR